MDVSTYRAFAGEPYSSGTPTALCAAFLCKRRLYFSFLPQHHSSNACEVGDGVYLGIAVFPKDLFHICRLSCAYLIHQPAARQERRFQSMVSFR